MRRLACLAIWLIGVGVAAAQPVASPTRLSDLPIARDDGRPRQPAPASPGRPSPPLRRWTLSVVTGLPSKGPLHDLERAMRDTGFDGPSGFCFFDFCMSGGTYPSSVSGRAYRDTWTASVNRRIGPRLGVSITGGRTLIGWTTGRDRTSGAFLEIENAMTHIAPVATFTPAAGLRLSAGPGLFTTTFTGNGSGLMQSPLGTTRRLGLLAEASLTFPRRSRVFAELSAQERWLGRQPLGPVDVLPDGLATFPLTHVRVAHWFVGLGCGVRF